MNISQFRASGLSRIMRKTLLNREQQGLRKIRLQIFIAVIEELPKSDRADA